MEENQENKLCPLCKSVLNNGAIACHACGAVKGATSGIRRTKIIGWIVGIFMGLIFVGLTENDNFFWFSAISAIMLMIEIEAHFRNKKTWSKSS